MRTNVLATCGILLLSFLTARGEDTFESLGETMIKTLKKTVAILGAVKDKQTADDALPKLKEAGITFNALRARLGKLGAPSEEQKKVFQEKFQPQLIVVFGDLQKETARLDKVDDAKDIVKELQTFKDQKGESFESLGESLIKALKMTVEVLATVKDKQTADDARPKLKVAGRTLADLKARMEKLGAPSKEQNKVFQEKFMAQVKTVLGDLFKEIARVDSLDDAKDVLQELEAFKFFGKKGPKKTNQEGSK